MAVVVSIDAGTTGVRSFALDENGEQGALSYKEFRQYYPRPGWVEHNAAEIWHSVQATLSELASVLDQPVAAVGITNQRQTVVAWSRISSEPLCRAIVWQDLRTSERCDQLLESGRLDQIRKTTGLMISPYFSATKIEWLIKNGDVELSPDLAFGTIDSWLIWKLSGGSTHATDVTNASGTLLYDLNEGCWSQELCVWGWGDVGFHKSLMQRGVTAACWSLFR